MGRLVTSPRKATAFGMSSGEAPGYWKDGFFLETATNATGFKCVTYRNDTKVFVLRETQAKGTNQVVLGQFAKAEDAALAWARYKSDGKPIVSDVQRRQQPKKRSRCAASCSHPASDH